MNKYRHGNSEYIEGKQGTPSDMHTKGTRCKESFNQSCHKVITKQCILSPSKKIQFHHQNGYKLHKSNNNRAWSRKHNYFLKTKLKFAILLVHVLQKI